MKDNFNNLLDFKGLQIKLASSEEILSWSHGEVTKPETINYRSWRPEKDGLFCERIFGPTRDWECYCGKYKKIRFKGVVCDKCGVEVAPSRVRRERMGHIKLAAPVVHLWYLRTTPSPLSLLTEIPQKELESVTYFARYLIVQTDRAKFKESEGNLEKAIEKKKEAIIQETKKQISHLETESKNQKQSQTKRIKNKDQLTLAREETDLAVKQKIQKLENKSQLEQEKVENLGRFLKEKIKSLTIGSTISDEELYYLALFKADTFFKTKMGAEAIKSYLDQLDLKKTLKELKESLEKTRSKAKKKRLVSRLRLINGMLENDISPGSMIFGILPVIPPDLRPMVQLTGGRFATSDLNDLYRRVINRNNRLKKLVGLGAPEIILRNEKRMLQEAVDMLIDASKSSKKRRKTFKRVPRSLSDLLRGKKGRFRRNLLGKRVDYSGRSVIVVGPELGLDECGLPKEIAIEIYRPFVLRELMLRGFAPNIKSAKTLIDHRSPEIYDILEDITKDNFILLNRAPTLHKLSIQAFRPRLIDGLAIRLHPCVCSGFNADFDGDQMGVHLPLSEKSQKEAQDLMLPSENLLKPSDSSPISIPAKEMAVGCFYLTTVRQEDLDKEKDENYHPLTVFSGFEELSLAHQAGKISLRELVFVSWQGKIIKTTYGRAWFNTLLPESFPYVNEPVDGKKIGEFVTQTLSSVSRKAAVNLIDSLKDFGFYGFTVSGISLSMRDCGSLPEKKKIIKEADLRVLKIEENFKMGLITSDEKRRLTHNIWMEVTEDIASKIWNLLPPDSPIRLISGSGIKRVSRDQIKQLSGMRGLMVDPLGNIVPLPTKSNFREGLSIFEYVTGSRGTRKGLTDTALKTADAGYLTRRLVDVSHTCIVREEDCGTNHFLLVKRNTPQRERYFTRRILGRILAKEILHPKTKKPLAKSGQFVDNDLLQKIEEAQVNEVAVRSPLACRSRYGVCAHCYGWDMSTRSLVQIGVPIGVVAAQSIGEPGTQLTMRTKHVGGVVGLDVTQGLPRVQELFEVRLPKTSSPLSEIDGKVKVKETESGWEITVTETKVTDKKTITYLIPLTATLSVSDGDLVAAGTQLCSGSLDVLEVLQIRGISAAQEYLVNNIQYVYESQGISVHDKHFEIIVREMSGKVRIEEPGDSDFLYGQAVELAIYEDCNKELKAKKLKIARGKKTILGLIQASLSTYSWLSASSFQETTNVITEASLLAKTDRLLGLKENVIIGRLIPTSPERMTIWKEK